MEFEWSPQRRFSARKPGRLLVAAGASRPAGAWEPCCELAALPAQPPPSGAGAPPPLVADVGAMFAQGAGAAAVPVPLVTFGRLFAAFPLPANLPGRPPIDPALLTSAAAQSWQDVRKWAASVMAPDSGGSSTSGLSDHAYWTAAAHTSPLAAAIAFAATVPVGGRRALFVERGAAEGLASGLLQAEAVPPSSKAGGGESGAVARERFRLRRTAATRAVSGHQGTTPPPRGRVLGLPVRLALNLLACVPRRLLLLAPSGIKRGGGDAAREYEGGDSLDSVHVFFIPTVRIVQRSAAGAVHFTPAFLSRASMAHFVRTALGLAQQQTMAARRQRRLEWWAQVQRGSAMLAGGAPGAPPAGGSGEEGSGLEEPPEVQEMARELEQSLAVDAQNLGTPRLGPAKSGVVRAGATLVCGLATLLAAPAELAATAVDRGLGGLTWALLERHAVERSILRRPLPQLLRLMRAHNRAMSAAAAAAGASPLAYAQTLAASALVVGVASKMEADRAGSLAWQHQLTPESKAPPGTGAPPRPGPLSPAVSRALAALKDAGLSPGDDPQALLAALLAAHLPLLEHNGFAALLGAAGAAAVVACAVGRMQGAQMGLATEVMLQVELLLGGSRKAATEERADGAGEEFDDEEFDWGRANEMPLGQGLVLVGDPDLGARGRSPSGLFLGGGMCVGVDDGAELLAAS